MLVTFTSPAGPDLTFFGDVAVDLLKMMGHSGTVPSAIRATDIPAALEKLERALASRAPRGEPSADADDGEHVSLDQRALPLIELLRAAAAADEAVMWSS